MTRDPQLQGAARFSSVCCALVLATLAIGCAGQARPASGDAFYRTSGTGEMCFDEAAQEDLPCGGPDAEPETCDLRKRERPRSLHEAAMCLDVAKVHKFVEAGADVRALDRQGRAALNLALTSYDTYWHPPDSRIEAIVRYLLEHGADPNLRFAYGEEAHYTPLAFAAYDGNLRLVRLLVEHGAKVNLTDDRGQTAAHAAAVCDFRLSCDDCTSPQNPDPPKAGALPTIRYLAEHGADLAAKTTTGTSVIDMMSTPCKENPAACSAEHFDEKAWTSGTCVKTYRYLTSVLAHP
jgi:Ankyrin repeats (3 copies)